MAGTAEMVAIAKLAYAGYSASLHRPLESLEWEELDASDQTAWVRAVAPIVDRHDDTVRALRMEIDGLRERLARESWEVCRPDLKEALLRAMEHERAKVSPLAKVELMPVREDGSIG